MRSSRLGLAIATGVLATLGLAACGPATTADGTDATVQVSEALSADGQGLAAIGFDPMDLGTENTATGSDQAQAGADSAGGADGADLPVTPLADGPSSAAPGTTRSAAPDATRSTAPDATRSAAPGSRTGANRHRALRRIALRRHNVLHGEFAVHTRQGDQTVAVQRGTVTAVSGTEITVKSSDGFTQTWRLDDQLRVIANRARADLSAVSAGATIGIAGVRADGGYQGRLILVPAK